MLMEYDRNTVLRWVDDRIRHGVFAGFLDPSVLRDETFNDYKNDLAHDELRKVIDGWMEKYLAEYYAVQADWPPITDCDRLDCAFALLQERGIVARQDYSCCWNCGLGEICLEVQAMQQHGETVRGYTFYDMQNTQGAVRGSPLYLYYGSVEEGEATALVIGREIVEELTHFGLATRWNGNWEDLITVELDWKRRRKSPRIC
jgi:hypothetical protein